MYFVTPTFYFMVVSSDFKAEFFYVAQCSIKIKTRLFGDIKCSLIVPCFGKKWVKIFTLCPFSSATGQQTSIQLSSWLFQKSCYCLNFPKGTKPFPEEPSNLNLSGFSLDTYFQKWIQEITSKNSTYHFPCWIIKPNNCC